MNDLIKHFDDVMMQIANSGDFDVMAAGENAPDESAIHALESRLGREFPDDYRWFLNHFGGFAVVAKKSIWPRPTADRIVASFRFEYSVIALGQGKGIPDDLNIEKLRPLVGDEPLLPVLRWPPTDTLLCFGADDAIYRWSAADPQHAARVGDTFLDTLTGLLEQLLERTNRLKQNPDDGVYLAK